MRHAASRALAAGFQVGARLEECIVDMQVSGLGETYCYGIIVLNIKVVVIVEEEGIVVAVVLVGHARQRLARSAGVSVGAREAGCKRRR